VHAKATVADDLFDKLWRQLSRTQQTVIDSDGLRVFSHVVASHRILQQNLIIVERLLDEQAGSIRRRYVNRAFQKKMGKLILLAVLKVHGDAEERLCPARSMLPGGQIALHDLSPGGFHLFTHAGDL